MVLFKSAFGNSETGFATLEDSMSKSNYSSYKVSNNMVAKDSAIDEEDYQNYLKQSAEKLKNVSFEIKRDKELSPYDISFEDYQYLNWEALEVIFGKGTDELHDAAEIMRFSNMTDDKVLNKINYDKLKETKGDDSWNDFLFSHIAVATLDFKVFGEESNNDKPFFQSTDGYLITKEDLFTGFEKFKESISEGNYNWQIDTDGVLKTMDEIKAEYEKRVAQNNTLLEELTKNKTKAAEALLYSNEKV